MANSDTIPLQDRFPGMHSDQYTRALRAIPGDVLLTLPDHQIDALVKQIVYALAEAVHDAQSLERAAATRRPEKRLGATTPQDLSSEYRGQPPITSQADTR